jgi:hypothetical protein
MDDRNANIEDTAPTEDTASTTRLGRRVAPAFPTRCLLGYGMAGTVGGGVLAIIQHLGPGFLTEPALVRWVFLYALLGGVGAGVWKGTARWAAARFSLSRWGAVATSGLLAGTLVGAAVLVVATSAQGTGDGALLLGLPWKDGLGGFVGGVAGGGLDMYFNPRYFT